MQVGTSKHQSLQVLHLLRRQRRRATTALGIAQPAGAIVIVAVNPVAPRLAIHAAGLCCLGPRPSPSTKIARSPVDCE